MKRQEIPGKARLMRCLVDEEKREAIINAADAKNETYSKFMIDASYKEAVRILRHKGDK